MPRPIEPNPGGMLFGALLGGLRGGPGGAVLGGLAGAVLTNGKQPLEQAMAVAAQQLGWNTRAIHWLTKREVEVALQRGNQPLQVLRLKVGPGAKTKEALDDEIYDQFNEQLRHVGV